MDKQSDTAKFSKKRTERHGKAALKKDNKNLFGFPSEKAYRNHKDEFFPQVLEKKKEFRRLKQEMRKLTNLI